MQNKCHGGLLSRRSAKDSEQGAEIAARRGWVRALGHQGAGSALASVTGTDADHDATGVGHHGTAAGHLATGAVHGALRTTAGRLAPSAGQMLTTARQEPSAAGQVQAGAGQVRTWRGSAGNTGGGNRRCSPARGRGMGLALVDLAAPARRPGGPHAQAPPDGDRVRGQPPCRR